MTFIEFKKLLLDAETTLPKFSKLIKVSEKNLQSYKKKGEVPNAIAALVACFAHMHSYNIDYKEVVNSLELKAKKKKGSGFGNQKAKKEEESEVKQ
ncbi:MAG TPA: hypothetical protein ENL00_01365 [Nitratifractor sp.]|jgi:hypothetical protein|nr:hypothetical protein [Nitratifractor sp.]